MALTIKGLRVFDAVISGGSLAAASQHLNMSQSAASRQIIELEHALKLDLFYRTSRHLKPTAEGLDFHREAQNILSGIREIPAIVEDIKTHARTSLSVVVMPRLALGVVASAVSRFREIDKQTKVSINMLRRHDIHRWAATQSFDIGFGTMPITHRAIDTIPIFDARAAVLVPKDHRLAKKAEVMVDDLLDEPLIGYLPGLTVRDQMDDLIRSSGVEIPYAIEVSSALLACQMVAEGAGVTIVDASTISRFRFYRELVLVPVRPTRWWALGAFTLVNSEPNPLAKSLVACVVDIVDELSKKANYKEMIRFHPGN